jgi:hypothetical protein
MKTELSNNILCGDCDEILRELPSNSIDLVNIVAAKIFVTVCNTIYASFAIVRTSSNPTIKFSGGCRKSIEL